jgi:hypothetical protein
MVRGFRAGGKLADALPMTLPPAPPSSEWLDHCTVRFETLMWLQQKGLFELQDRSAVFLEALAAGGLTPKREKWAGEAVKHTRKLLDCADKWGPPPKDVDFTPEKSPEPEPVMRVVPKA